MRLRYEMNIIKTDAETIAVPITESDNGEFKGILRMNESTEAILNLLKEDTTVDEVVAKLKKEYNVSEEFLKANVNKVIDILKKDNLLID